MAPGRAIPALGSAEVFYVIGSCDAGRANADPKFLALSRLANAKASSREYRNVPGCLAAQLAGWLRREKEDEVAEFRHYIGRGRAEDLRIGEDEGDDGSVGSDGFDSVRRHDETHELQLRGIDRLTLCKLVLMVRVSTRTPSPNRLLSVG
jgi:hypothetical protein